MFTILISILLFEKDILYLEGGARLMKVKISAVVAAAFITLFGGAAALANEPVRGVYYGSNKFGDSGRIANLVELLKKTEINTIVIDKKDDNGIEVSRDYFKKLIAPFRASGAGIMCRIVALKDNVYAKSKNGAGLTLKSMSRQGRAWTDRRGSKYLDPALEGTSDYIIEVSLRAIRDGCDSLNFDYIRLPSPRDGNTRDTKYPPAPKKRAGDPSHERNVEKRRVMNLFLGRMVTGIRKEYPDVPLAASVFGYACYGFEPGVGQYLDDFALYGFIISCMAYPTHYSCNDEAPDPSYVPYVIYRKTTMKARAYLNAKGFANTEFIMWLQGFNLPNINGCGLGKNKEGKTIGIKGKKGAIVEYEKDPKRFREQIRPLNDLGMDSWIVWHPSARYAPNLFKPKKP